MSKKQKKKKIDAAPSSCLSNLLPRLDRFTISKYHWLLKTLCSGVMQFLSAQAGIAERSKTLKGMPAEW